MVLISIDYISSTHRNIALCTWISRELLCSCHKGPKIMYPHVQKCTWGGHTHVRTCQEKVKMQLEWMVSCLKRTTKRRKKSRLKGSGVTSNLQISINEWSQFQNRSKSELLTRDWIYRLIYVFQTMVLIFIDYISSTHRNVEPWISRELLCSQHRGPKIMYPHVNISTWGGHTCERVKKKRKCNRNEWFV